MIIPLLHLLYKDLPELRQWCKVYAPEAKLMRCGIVDGAIFDLQWKEHSWNALQYYAFSDRYDAWGVDIDEENAALLKLTWYK